MNDSYEIKCSKKLSRFSFDTFGNRFTYDGFLNHIVQNMKTFILTFFSFLFLKFNHAQLSGYAVIPSMNYNNYLLVLWQLNSSQTDYISIDQSKSQFYETFNYFIDLQAGCPACATPNATTFGLAQVNLGANLCYSAPMSDVVASVCTNQFCLSGNVTDSLLNMANDEVGKLFIRLL